VTLRKIEEPERFEEKFRTLLELTKAERVVIAIDDLDRCKPELVDKFLAMLKTYVEPVARDSDFVGGSGATPRRGADAVFAISADEAAVRRHMIARELESLPRLAFQDDAAKRLEQEQQQLRDAADQVDEYLRKFFNAVIRVRPLLPEDIKSFTREQLSKFFSDHMPTDRKTAVPDQPQPGGSRVDERERLVSMVAGALRKNPRRIKQFVNNLDARLRTIEQREASGRIAAGISDDILGIAKIAIIEEEWRDEYDALEANPRLLAEWQAKAISDGLPNRELRSFLQFNRDIAPRNVEAVVNLKLEKDDLTLPDFGVFRDAVAYGDFESARDVIARAPSETQPEYAARLPELLERELGRDGFVEARNVLDAALQNPPLGLDDHHAQERMVGDALAYAQVVLQFLTLDPHSLFAVADRLSASDQRRARMPFLTLTAIPTATASTDGVRRVCEELAIRVHTFDPGELQQLEQAVSQSQHLRSAWLPLVEAEPALLSESAANDAFQPLLVGDVDPDAADFKVAMIGVSRGLAQQSYAQYLEHLREFLPTAISESGRLRPFLTAAAETLSRMPADFDQAMAPLLVAIRADLGVVVEQLDTDGVDALLQVASAAEHLDSIGAATAAPEAHQLIQDLLDRYPDATARAVISRPSVLESQALGAVRTGLEAIVRELVPSAPHWSVVVEALLTMVDVDVKALVSGSLSRWIAAGQSTDAAVGLERLLFAPHGTEVAGWLQEDAFGDILAGVGSAFDTRVVAQLGEVDYEPTLLGALTYAISQWDYLSEAEHKALGDTTKRWLGTAPEASEDLANVVGSLPGARVSERRPFVQAFVAAARATEDHDVREVALKAAAQLAGDSATLGRLLPASSTSIEALPESSQD
jgi:hypothetical protein